MSTSRSLKPRACLRFVRFARLRTSVLLSATPASLRYLRSLLRGVNFTACRSSFNFTRLGSSSTDSIFRDARRELDERVIKCFQRQRLDRWLGPSWLRFQSFLYQFLFWFVTAAFARRWPKDTRSTDPNSASYESHGEIVMTIMLSNFVDRHNARMLKRRCRLSFSVKPSDIFLCRYLSRQDHL